MHLLIVDRCDFDSHNSGSFTVPLYVAGIAVSLIYTNNRSHKATTYEYHNTIIIIGGASCCDTLILRME